MTNLLMDLDALRAGRLTTLGQLDRPIPWVDPQDIAAVATMRLLSGEWAGRQVQAVHGPADLTWIDAASVLSTVAGIPIEAQRIDDDELCLALRASGMSQVAVEGILGMSVTQYDGFTPQQPRSALSTSPSSLASWAITQLRPAL